MRTSLGLLGALALAACSSAPPAGDDDDQIPTDDDTAGDCEGIDWGLASAYTVGQPVGNWALQGYVDGDGDGLVDAEEIAAALQDVQCRGHESLVVVAGDST